MPGTKIFMLKEKVFELEEEIIRLEHKNKVLIEVG